MACQPVALYREDYFKPQTLRFVMRTPHDKTYFLKSIYIYIPALPSIVNLPKHISDTS